MLAYGGTVHLAFPVNRAPGVVSPEVPLPCPGPAQRTPLGPLWWLHTHPLTIGASIWPCSAPVAWGCAPVGLGRPGAGPAGLGLRCPWSRPVGALCPVSSWRWEVGEGGLTARALLPACRGARLRLQTVQHQGGLGGCRGSPPVWSWQLRRAGWIELSAWNISRNAFEVWGWLPPAPALLGGTNSFSI